VFRFAKRVEIRSSGIKVCGTPLMLTRSVRNSARASIQRRRGPRDKAERSPALEDSASMRLRPARPLSSGGREVDHPWRSISSTNITVS